MAGLIRLFGARIKPFMERHFELAASALVVLAILGFAAIKYLVTEAGRKALPGRPGLCQSEGQILLSTRMLLLSTQGAVESA